MLTAIADQICNSSVAFGYLISDYEWLVFPLILAVSGIVYCVVFTLSNLSK
jgi:hypothetical protein